MTQERYLRHSLIDWFDQEQLSKSKVLVIGAGAIGNELIKNLALLGVGNFHIVDYDKIEIHNLTRSVLFNESHIGHYKSEIAAMVAKQLNPNINASFDVDDLWKKISIKDLKEYSAVFCCVDNYEARLRLNRLCYIAKTDYYNSGIDSRYVNVEYFPYAIVNNCTCYECNIPPSIYSKARERYSCGWLKKVSFEEKKIPTTIITASIAASQLISLFLQRKHSSGYQSPIKVFTDTITLQSNVVQQPKNELCYCCSSIDDNVIYINAKRNSDYLQNLQISINEDFEIELSDPIILNSVCKVCGDEIVYNDIAANYDDSITVCENCRVHSREVTIVDTVSYNSFSSLMKNKNLAVKFIKVNFGVNQFIIELED